VKLLLIDDPINSLSLIEDKLVESGVECVRTWDAADAREKCKSNGFNAIIASSLSILGEAVNFCLEEKESSKNLMKVALFTPYPLAEPDRTYLKQIGMDFIIGPAENNGGAKSVVNWANSTNGGGEPVCEYDSMRLMKIARYSYEFALKDLASRAHKLDEILENSSDVVYELDPYGKITLISKAIEKLTGYSRNELMGMSAMDVVSSDSLELVASHISMLLSGEADPPAVEVGVQAKSGHVIPAEMIVRPIRHENQVVGILGIGRNVEERKRLEENLRRVINAKDFYLDLMSHDLQNFNQAILGYLEMILATEQLDPKLERYAKGALRQVMQTATLIAHLKRVAQIRGMKTKPMEIRDLKDIAQTGITKLQSRLDKNNIIIAFECSVDKCPVIAGDDLNDLLELLITAVSRYAISDLVHLKVSLASEIIEGVKFWTIEISGHSLKLSQPAVQCVMSQDYSGCLTIDRPDLQLLVVRAIVETQGGVITTRAQENGRGDRFVIRFPQA
jgi:PAS domain S-box-containing protein